MNKIKFYVLCFIFILCFTKPLLSSYFLRNIENVPLMPGLYEDLDSAVIFESSAGRISETYATGRFSEEVVLKFYKQTLPQLGWKFESSDKFYREGEVLRLKLTPLDAEKGIIEVYFKIAPAIYGE